MNKYVLYLNIEEKTIEYILPGIDNRKGFLDLSRETGLNTFIIPYEVYDGEWHLFTDENVRFSREHRVIDDLKLEDAITVTVKAISDNTRFAMMVSRFDSQKAVFGKYDIRNENRISIGKSNGNDIVLNDSFVSTTHAVLFKNGDEWWVENQGRNGTFLNGRLVNNTKRVKTFDVITISGYKFIYLPGIIAVNRTGDLFSRLGKLNIDSMVSTQKHADTSLISRNPRRIEPLDETEIEIEAPPAKEKRNKMPLIFTLGPSLTMPIPILAMFMFSILGNTGGGSKTSYFGMVISVILFSALGVMWALLRHRYEKRTSAETEAARVAAYTEYIAQNAQLIEEKQLLNKDILARNYKEASSLASTLQSSTFELWNRNVNHSDFMTVRIGRGWMDSPNPIKVPKQRFSVEQDELTTYPHQIYERYKYVDQITKTIDLKANKIIGVIGREAAVTNIANEILVGTASLHSYRDVKIIMLMRHTDEFALNWVKWLPHTFSNDKKVRFVGDSPETRQNVLYQIADIFRKRQEGEAGAIPHLLIVSTDKTIFDGESAYKYMTDEGDYGATFLLLHGDMDALPNECKFIVECTSDTEGAVYRLDESFTPSHQISNFDLVGSSLAEGFARRLSGIHTNELDEGEIPEMVDYFELLGIGDIEDWNLIKRYKENRSFEGLKALVGLAAGGREVYLDIHEKKFGPHGLLAGTTGSGKSETLQSFILSLALNYHPDEVAFVLIDYKGGGMANIFDGIPHIAGIITNVGSDEGDAQSAYDNQTRRALISIRSEIKRRETAFNKYKVSHIDQYMRFYRDGTAKECIPHLIMISDEFAELKKEQPEFIKELVSTARVGRSLGIHLILATQKPAGVVDDEIWSNSRFKVCLRVQDKQDSMGMLKRPEAAYLTQTGRAYLQIGNDEIFEQFQTGYSGAKYEPKKSGLMDGDGVRMISVDGTPAYLHPKAKGEGREVKSQIDVSVEYITRISKNENIGMTPALWLPMLPKNVSLTQIEEKYSIEYPESIAAAVGIIDIPEKQSQHPLILDFNGMANLLIVGNTGAGKTNFVQTMIYSLFRHYTPNKVQFYIMDFSSRTLNVFNKLPHCGGVLFPEDEDGVNRLIGLLFTFISERKDKLSKAGIGSFTEYRKVHKDLPMIFLIIDNFFELMQSYPDMEDSIMRLTRDGVKYGIQTVVTLNRLGDMRYKLVQNFNNSMAVQLSERGDYMEVLGGSPDFMPSQIPGRGILFQGGITVEYQVALPDDGETEVERTHKVNACIDRYAKDYKDERAKRIPILPVHEEFGEYIEKNKNDANRLGLLPLGYRVKDISLWGIELKKSYLVCASSASSGGIAEYINNAAYAAREMGFGTVSVRLNRMIHGIDTSLMDETYADYEGMVELLAMLKDVFKERASAKKEYAAEHPEYNPGEFAFAAFEKKFVFIDDMGKLADMVYKESHEISLTEIIETFFAQGAFCGIYFIGGFPTSMDSTSYYLPAIKTFVGNKDIVHFEGKLSGQKLIPCAMPISEQNKARSKSEGYYFHHDETEWVYMPPSKNEE